MATARPDLGSLDFRRAWEALDDVWNRARRDVARRQEDVAREWQATASRPPGAAIPMIPVAVQPADSLRQRGAEIVSVSAVLEAWRAAERLLAAEPDDSPDRARIQQTIVELRILHRRLFDAGLEQARQEPTWWVGR
jgi:hypothetical protein